MASYERKYGTGTGADIYINIPKAGSANHAVSADWTPAAGDVKISKDGGAAANIGTLPTAIAMGNSTIWKFVFTDAELQAKFISVTVSDSATKAVDDTGFSIETYGHASALHPFDRSSATVTPAAGSITASVIATGAIDRDAFNADTGLQSIRSNTAQAGAATTITLDASASSTDDFYNGCSILLTGGTGAGQARIITDYVGSTKVATVDTAWVTNPASGTTFAIFPAASTAEDIAAAVLTAAAADPIAANVVEVSDDATAAASLESMLDGTGAKLYLKQLAINAEGDDHAILAVGSGTGSGIFAAGGATNASGIDAVGQGTGSGITAQATEDGGSGLVVIGLGTGNGLSAIGGDDGHGIDAAGGTGGSIATHGIRGTGGSLNGCGLRGVGGPTGAGIGGLGGATSGAGIRGAGQAGDSAGIEGQGQGTNAGLKAIGGADGHGLYAVGGATSGAGLVAEAAAGNNNGATFIKAGSGVDLDADITGHLTGNVSGSIGSLGAQAKADVNAEADTALADVGVTTTVTGRIDAAISTRSTLTQAQVNTEADAALADVGLTTVVTGRIDAAISSRSSHAAADVWGSATRTLTDSAGVKKNTALTAFTFKMCDRGDHVTGKTGLTVTATRSIDGAAFASCANAVTELSNGFYKVDLAAADLNGDVITLRFTASGADATEVTIKTAP